MQSVGDIVRDPSAVARYILKNTFLFHRDPIPAYYIHQSNRIYLFYVTFRLGVFHRGERREEFLNSYLTCF